MAEITDELRVLVTAEVEKAVRNLKKVDAQTKQTEKMFKSLGAAIGVTFSAAAIVKFVKESDAAYREHNQTVNVLKSTLKATGAEAWTSAQELQNMAGELQNATNYTADSINSMQSVLLGFKNISSETFGEATKAILDMATVMDMDLKSAAQSIGKALDDPINGMDSLKKQGFNFTAAQKKVIQSLIDTGETAKAQKIILDELNGTFGGAAEAAADSATQIKNAFSDVLRAYGHEFNELLSSFNNKNGKNGIAGLFEGWANNVEEGIKDWHRLLNFEDWYGAMSDTEQLEEASRQLEIWTEKYNKANKSILPGLKKRREEAEKNMKIWENEISLLETSIQKEKEVIATETERKNNESAINDLMLEISKNYEKLSRSDPVIQLENYRKKLEEIAKNKDKLSAASPEIDTSKALAQLDYLEKEIKKKMLSISINGKQTWQKYLSDMLNVELGTFDTGAEAVEQFIAGMESEVAGIEKVSELLGKKIDLKPTLLKQKEEIREILISMFSIDPDKIDESFEAADGSVQKLIDRYKELPDEIEFDTLSEKIGYFTEQWALSLDGIDKKTAAVIGNLNEQLSQLSFESSLNGIKAFGQALGEGKDASDAMAAAMAEMAQEILNQLPMLFLQAGLQLIAQGQWPLGLGFVAAAGSSALIAGYTNGATSKAKSDAKANALGGVYGDEGYAAFAKGGTFTNAIVSSPTYFRFAKGSGFGTGLMGEAGPEAIMPLTRGADGSLGVRAEGMGGGVVINIPVTVYSDEPVEVNDSTGEDGQRKIEILVGSMINKHLSDGSADRALKSRYGLKAQGV